MRSIIRLFCAFPSVVLYFTEPLICALHYSFVLLSFMRCLISLSFMGCLILLSFRSCLIVLSFLSCLILLSFRSCLIVLNLMSCLILISFMCCLIALSFMSCLISLRFMSYLISFSFHGCLITLALVVFWVSHIPQECTTFFRPLTSLGVPSYTRYFVPLARSLAHHNSDCIFVLNLIISALVVAYL